jgi:hypothetical protein
MTSHLSPIAELAPNRVGEAVGTYAVAYLDAAGVLLRHGAAGRGMQDLCFYPAAHNLRHGLELVAKQIADYVAYELRDPGLLYEPGHSLKKAWEKAPATFTQHVDHDEYCESPGDVGRAMKTIASLITKLDTLDPSGTLFRYPESVTLKAKKKQTGDPAVDRERVDQHVPHDRVDLGEWAKLADDGLCAAQLLCHYFDERTSFLRHRRGDPPASLADLTTGKVTDEEKVAYRKHVGWGPDGPSEALGWIETIDALRADGTDVRIVIGGKETGA